MCQEYDKAVNYTMQTVKALFFFKVNNYSQNYDFRNSYKLKHRSRIQHPCFSKTFIYLLILFNKSAVHKTDTVR